MARRNLILAGLLIGLQLQFVSGCARWGDSLPQQIPSSGEMKMSRNQSGVRANSFEVVVAQLDNSQIPDFNTFWSQLDSQQIPLDLRKRLDQNGVQCAVMTNQTPAILNSLLKPRPLDPAQLEDWQQELLDEGLIQPASRMAFHRRIQIIKNQSKEIASSASQSQQSWVVRNGDKQSVGVGSNVQGVWSLSSVFNGDGSVNVILEPVILHGESRAQIGVSEGDFMMQNRQDRTPLEDLRIETRLSPGETLVVAPTNDLSDLGALFFAAAPSNSRNGVNDPSIVHINEHESQHRVLLIRLEATQVDDLFREQKFARKLSDISLN